MAPHVPLSQEKVEPTSGESATGAPAPAPERTGEGLPGPLGAETYEARIRVLLGRMEAAGAAAVLVPPGPDMRYLTGLDLERGERIAALVLDLEGRTMIVCPDHAAASVESGPVGIDEIVSIPDYEDPNDALAKYLKKRKLAKRRIAMGAEVGYDKFARLHASLPDLTFVSTTPILGYLRERKGPQEMTIIRAALAIVERSITAAWGDVREGMTERELSESVSDRIQGETEEIPLGSWVRVQFGARTAEPHLRSGLTRLAANEPIVIEAAASVHGYWARLTRTAVLGEVSGRMKMIQERLFESRFQALNAAKPGVACSAAYVRSKAALASRGFDKFIPDRLGQGFGLALAEPPWISPGYHEPFAEGNVFFYDPGVLTPGDYGIRNGDIIVVDKNGGRALTSPLESIPSI